MLTAVLQPHEMFAQRDGGGSGFNLYFFLVILALIAVQHIAERIKAKRDAEMQEEDPPDDAHVWEEWLEEEEAAQSAPTSPREALVDFFRSVTAPPPPPEIVVPPPPPPPSVDPEPAIARVPDPPRQVRATSDIASSGTDIEPISSQTDRPLGQRQRKHSSAEHTALGKMLRDPASLRNAFILKEILEPPLAAREEDFPHTI